MFGRRVLGIMALWFLVAVPSPHLASVSEDVSSDSARVATPAPHRSIGDDISGDFRALASRRTLVTLAAGGALAALSLGHEDPVRADALLDRAPLEAPANVGNRYGDSSTLAAGALGLFAIGAVTGKDNLRLAGWDLTRSLLYSGAVVWALKVSVSRTRPNGGPFSFPSGHAAEAFAAAPVLAAHFGMLAAVPAYALAATTALGRVEDQKHYVSDVIFGSAIGFATGSAIARSGAERSRLMLGVTPDGVACSIRF